MVGSEVKKARPLPLGLEHVAEIFVLALETLLAPHEIDGAVFGRAHEPRPGVVRDAVAWPLLERCHHRILGELLGEPDVAHDARESGDEPRRLDPADRVDRAMHVGSRHERRSEHLFSFAQGPTQPLLALLQLLREAAISRR
jgi:hypothetical protein